MSTGREAPAKPINLSYLAVKPFNRARHRKMVVDEMRPGSLRIALRRLITIRTFPLRCSMRGIMIFAVAVVLCLQPMGPAQSQDEARAIIGKAIKAMGVDKEPENSKGLLMKSKGTLEAMGM